MRSAAIMQPYHDIPRSRGSRPRASARLHIVVARRLDAVVDDRVEGVVKRHETDPTDPLTSGSA